MTYVVTENCIRCKYQDCVEVCPVDCFHEGPNFLVIDPAECIDCSLCEPECPARTLARDGARHLSSPKTAGRKPALARVSPQGRRQDPSSQHGNQ